MAKKAAAKKAKAKGDGGKRAAKDKATKTASAAKATKPVKADKEATRKSAESSGMRVIGATALGALIKKVRELNGEASELNGKAGEAIAKAVKDSGVHPAALKFIMTQEARAGRNPAAVRAFLDAIDYYRDIRKLDDKCGDSLFTAPELDGDEGGDEPDETEGDTNGPQEPESGVVQFPGNGEARASA